MGSRWRAQCLSPMLLGAAADDALQRWTARAYLLADHNVPDSNEDGLVVLLRRFRNLRTLELDWSRLQEPPRSLSAAALQALASLRRLETLTLCGCYPTAELFPAVAALPSLHSLVFEPYVGWSRGISFESRRAFAARPDVSVAPLARCTALASLELRNVDTAVRPGMDGSFAAELFGPHPPVLACSTPAVPLGSPACTVPNLAACLRIKLCWGPSCQLSTGS